MTTSPKIFISERAFSERRSSKHTDALSSLALKLALQLHVPVLEPGTRATADFEFYLQYDKNGLALYQNTAKAPSVLRVDFGNQDLQRRTDDNLLQQNICKAVGLNRHRGSKRPAQHLQILDAMAGLGKDAWLLANAGAAVEMLERDAIVHALLYDALHRGQSPTPTSPLQRLQLRHADFLDIASELPVYDVVYLDPMFPVKNKQAKAKKDMFLLQSLLQDSSCDEERLLAVARVHARSRIVVKRAKLSPHLGGQRPDVQFKGSANRYDVYMIHGDIEPT